MSILDLIGYGPPNIEKLKTKGNVKKLIKALGYKKDINIRRDAAEVLGKTGDARAVEPLVAALKDTSKDVRMAAAEALGKTGDARAVEPLVALLKDKSYFSSSITVRMVAAEALGKIGGRRAVEPLVAATKDESENIRVAAAKALDRIGWQPDESESGASYWIAKRQWERCIEIGKLAVKPLIVALKDTSPEVRGAAAKTLGQIGDAEAVKPLTVTLKDTNSQVRRTAIEALGEIGDTAAIESLNIALNDANLEVCRVIVKALMEIDNTNAVTLVMNAVRNSKYPIQARLTYYLMLDQMQGVSISSADEKDLVEATATTIRSLYGRTTTRTHEVFKGYETIEHTGKVWDELPVGSPGHYGWVEVVETETIPIYDQVEETIPDPDKSGIREIIELIPKKLYKQIRNLSGEAKGLFE